METLDLTKGQKLDLSKVAQDAGQGSLTEVTVGLAWEENQASKDSGQAFDADLVLVLADANGVSKPEYCIYFGQRSTANGSVQLSEDNQTGDKEGDDEEAHIKLNDLPADVEKIFIYATIFEASIKNQTFGKLNNSGIRLINKATGDVLAKFELDFDASNDVSNLFGILIKRNGSWFVETKGESFAGEIAKVFEFHGVNA